MSWRQELDPFQSPPLFTETFLAKWDSSAWQPDSEDEAAAAKLHIQVVSRITTQPLGYRDGDEKTALISVFKLFDKAREVATVREGVEVWLDHQDIAAGRQLSTTIETAIDRCDALLTPSSRR